MDWIRKRRRVGQTSHPCRLAGRRQLSFESLEGRLLLAGVSSLSSEALTVSLQDGLDGYHGTVDASVRGDNPTANFGAKDKMELDGNPDQIALIRWDTTSIPPASTVTSVELTFNVINTSEDDFEIYEALRAWDEASVTYGLAASGQPWEGAGVSGSTDRGSDVLAALTGTSRGLVTTPLNSAGVATVQRWIRDPRSNYGIVIQDLNNASTNDLDVSSSENKQVSFRPKLTITYLPTPPAATVTVDRLLTNDPSPPLSGTVSDPGATVTVAVGGQSKIALNHGDGTWMLADNQLAPLVEGVHNVVVTASAGSEATDATSDELTIDTTPPSTTLNFPQDSHTYNMGSWPDSLSGLASDLGGAVVQQVQVSIQRLSDNQFWSGAAFDSSSQIFLNAVGTTNWTFTLSGQHLTDGEYAVVVHATDTAGNVEGATTSRFTFDTTPPPAPIVTINHLITNDPSPSLQGTVSSPGATVTVTVGGQSKNAVNHGDGTWTLADNQLAPLAEGVYDVSVTATAGSVGTDSTSDELIIDTTNPAIAVSFPMDDARYRSATWLDSLSGTSSDTGGSGLELVEVSIRRLSDGRYWSGGGWDQTSEFCLLPTGTSDWSLSLADSALTDGASYRVTARGVDKAGNLSTATADFTFDTTRPSLATITRHSPATSPTSADTLVFRVIFDESVSNVDSGDFVATGSSASVASVQQNNSKSYDVTVTGGAVGLSGTIGLAVSDGENIRDLAGNRLSDVQPTTNQTYVVDPGSVSEPIEVSLQDGLNGYKGTVDASVRGDAPSSNYGTRKKMELDGNPDQVALIRWDATSIPSSSTVTSVSITLNVVNSSTDDFEIYEALRAWDETTVTYQIPSAGQEWAGPGVSGSADRGADVLGTVRGVAAGLVTIELNSLGVALVQRWVSDPANNYGIVIQDLNNATTDDLDISSREESRLGPKLTVTYTLGPPPPPNDPPQARDDAYSVDEDGVLIVAFAEGVLDNDTDSEGDTLRAIRLIGPSHGALALNPDGSFTYTPHENFYGADSFSYRADDGRSRGAGEEKVQVATVTIAVGARPDDPVADDDSISLTRNSSRSFEVLSNDSDPDGDSIEVISHTDPVHGSLSRSGGTFTYVPIPDYTGPDSFTYTIQDATGRTAVAMVSIDVMNELSPVTFRALGDVPYSQGEYAELRDDLANLGSDDLFFMHVGDIKSGSSACNSSVYSNTADVLLAAERTVFIIPGDNEWNDCSNPAQAWGYWESNFSRFDENWDDDFSVRRQAERDENFAFLHDGVLFLGINLVGGKVHDSQEWEQRMEDNSRWVRDNFAAYGGQVSAAVIFAHAFTDGARAAFGAAFVEAARQFEKPVLYLMGDKHNWKLDQPFSDAPNVTRVIVDQGVPSVRVTVTHDPDNPFQFDRSP